MSKKFMTAWVARDELGECLKMHWEKPVRTGRYPDAKKWWFSLDSVELPNNMYQGLNWEDEPVKVKVLLKDEPNQ